MIVKLLCSICLLYSLSYANKVNDAKFLVVDKNTYDKIEVLNILNGGINKEYIVSSKRLSQDNLKKYYPEFFVFSGPVCNSINKIVFTKKEFNEDIKLLVKEEEIKTEVNKIKLLQMLNEANGVINISKVNTNIIKSLGIICNNRVFLRGKFYGEDDLIGKLKIKSINSKNSSIYLEVK